MGVRPADLATWVRHEPSTRGERLDRAAGHLLGFVDRLGQRVVDGGDPFASELNERVWRWIGALSVRRAVVKVGDLGEAFLDLLDRVGARSRARLNMREWSGPVNRLPRAALVPVAASAIVLGMLAWGAYEAGTGGSAWMTDPGAAASETVQPVTAPATAAMHGDHSPMASAGSTTGGAAASSATGVTGAVGATVMAGMSR